MFKKILIANRGRVRVIRTCKEMELKQLLFILLPMQKVHVKFADEAVCIGPPPSNLSYLKMSNIIAAAEKLQMQMQFILDMVFFLNSKFSKIKNTESNLVLLLK
jgi:acetyl-CoA carboxylase biotin carboxylase subunit